MRAVNGRLDKKALIVFAKQPEAGRVKTRIAKTTGDQHALEIYQELLGILLKTLEPLQVPVYLYADRHPVFDREKTGFYNRIQRGEHLGEKMKNAFREVFEEGYEKVIIIGSDCPYLTEGTLSDAFEMLEQTDICMGPSLDGGYYLLGMRAFYPALFDDIPWSTPVVLRETLDKATQNFLSTAMLIPLEDIDTFEAWKAYKRKTNGKEKK